MQTFQFYRKSSFFQNNRVENQTWLINFLRGNRHDNKETDLAIRDKTFKKVPNLVPDIIVVARQLVFHR